MKIMSFNTQHCLNYLEQRIDFDIMAEAIVSCKADIVGLQEMRGKSTHPDYEAQVAILAEKTGLEYHYFAEAIRFDGENPYGNGFLSRYPIVSAETVLIPDPNPRAQIPMIRPPSIPRIKDPPLLQYIPPLLRRCLDKKTPESEFSPVSFSDSTFSGTTPAGP